MEKTYQIAEFAEMLSFIQSNYFISLDGVVILLEVAILPYMFKCNKIVIFATIVAVML